MDGENLSIMTRSIRPITGQKLGEAEVRMELFLLRRRRRREKEGAADAGSHRQAVNFHVDSVTTKDESIRCTDADAYPRHMHRR